YFVGTYGPGTAYLIGPADRAQDAANAGSYFDSSTPTSWGTISAPTTGTASWYFLAKLDSHMNFQWVKTPDSKGGSLAFPPDVGRVRWNQRTQRVYWSGYANGTLTMGNTGAELDPPLSGPNGFLAVF